MKAKYYQSANVEKIALKKLVEMSTQQATQLHEATKDEIPHQKLLTMAARKKSFSELSFKSLEYLWIGCEKSDLKIRLMAKAAYLSRVNEDNNPTKHLLFTLEENMEALAADEKEMIGGPQPQRW